jgi:hypothetical protein
VTPRSASAHLVVLGMMGRAPFAGVAWQVLHYLEGVRRLGHDVFYVEDTGSWPYDPEQNTVTDDAAYAIRYIGGLMEWVGLGDRWAYVAPDRVAHGPLATRLDEVLAHADVLLNLTGATVLREEHLRVPIRIYLETDPVKPQIEVARGEEFTIDLLSAHTHHFSFGENLGAPDCVVPVERFDYLPTRQPIVIDWWSSEGGTPRRDGRFTTVASWQQSGKDVEWGGETYLWSKHLEFEKFIELPTLTSVPLELALALPVADPSQSAAAAEVRARLDSNGWRVTDAVALSISIFPYRDYIRASLGEFTVAKDQYVRPRSGWFSDRSASYLAAGKPVVTQETGFSKILPTGEGLLSFVTLDEAVAALERVAADYGRHAAAARELAGEYFAAERVTGSLLERAGVRAGAVRP